MWILGLLLVLGAGAIMYVFWSSTHITFNPQTVSFTSVSVTKEHIKISGSSASSAIGYTGYEVESNNGVLYFTIKGSLQDTPFSRIRPFDISMPNTYGNITAIYIRGANPSEDKLVWKDGNIVYPSQQQ